MLKVVLSEHDLSSADGESRAAVASVSVHPHYHLRHFESDHAGFYLAFDAALLELAVSHVIPP